MARSSVFRTPSHEPFHHDPTLELDSKHTRGAFSFLNPTHARLRPISDSAKPTSNDAADREHPAQNMTYHWRSRDNRKGRHLLSVASSPSTPAPTSSSRSQTIPLTSTPRAVLRNIVRMCTYFPYWNISWWVAVIFTLGSVIWVMNAFFVYLPLVRPESEFPDEILVAGGWTAWIGATVFEIGSVLLMIEAVNENRAGCFGWALERAWDDVEDGATGGWTARPSTKCEHHHSNRKNFVGNGHEATLTSSSKESSDTDSATKTNERAWQWFPSWHDLQTHYFHELGFLACLFQLLGASIFWISGFTALPAIQTSLADTSQGVLDGAYWSPQVIGGTGFIISGLLFMLETQKKWYLPAWGVLGWHIGAWNLIGALGFTLCGVLGLAYENPGAQYQASLATFWGSWAFLVGSLVQWYEALDTHPVETINDKLS